MKDESRYRTPVLATASARGTCTPMKGHCCTPARFRWFLWP